MTNLSAVSGSPSERGVVVVTGGSAGLGRAAVRAFAAEGYDVAILARGVDGLAGAVADVVGLGRRALGVPTDVSTSAAVEAAADQIEAELGPIAVWVNNTMVGIFAPFTEIAPEDFERATKVNYLGAVNGTRAALRVMKPRAEGTILQVGSALAYRGIPLQSAYCGAKHAIVGFTESVITELLHDKSKIRVCMVHMPAMNTPQFGWVRSALPDHPQPVAPIYQPEVGAAALVHAAAHPKRSTWVGLPTVATALGNRVAAPLLDRYLARTGYSGQQTADIPPSTTDNLYEPLPGDAGARGAFDSKSIPFSPQLWLSWHTRPVSGLISAGMSAGRSVGGSVGGAVAAIKKAAA